MTDGARRRHGDVDNRGKSVEMCVDGNTAIEYFPNTQKHTLLPMPVDLTVVAHGEINPAFGQSRSFVD
jgi:hypothetical protein